METWFTSDLHLGHDNIIRSCNRPFKFAQEHDETIIENFNSVVTDKDIVYFLGDFSMKWKYVETYFHRLHGRWVWIKGNHDHSFSHKLIKQYPKKIEGFYDIRDIKVDNTSIVLCHYPMVSWNRSCHGSYQFYGHCHGTYDDSNKLSLDVGVDVWGFKPVHLEELKSKMLAKIAVNKPHFDRKLDE